jgi:hypothetical protein
MQFAGPTERAAEGQRKRDSDPLRQGFESIAESAFAEIPAIGYSPQTHIKCAIAGGQGAERQEADGD